MTYPNTAALSCAVIHATQGHTDPKAAAQLHEKIQKALRSGCYAATSINNQGNIIHGRLAKIPHGVWTLHVAEYETAYTLTLINR